ncbi:MAG: type II toxin-antitoxin system VapC family toxin [Gemmatimonadota bacterium]
MPPRAGRKFVLDTNCFVEASRRDAARADLEAFVTRAAPFLHLSSVVAGELLAGTSSPRDRRAIQEQILTPFLRRNRVITPGHRAWMESGRALSELVRREGLVLRSMPRSFLLDLLIAASCREAGAVFVTHNHRDAERIARVLPFTWVEAYPALS